MSASVPPTDPAASVPPMEPAASTDVLSLAESRKLLQYVWSGVLLPTDLDNFNRRIGRKGDDHRLDEMIRDLLVTYQRIKSHCGLFKDTTYPNIINLASLIYDYSQTAGGEEDDSYYANILSAGKLLYEEKQKAKPDQKVIDEQSGIMKDLIDAQIEAIEKLRTEAQRVTTSLSDFETECKGDELELKGKIAPIDNQLNGEGGKVKQLQDDIAAKKKQIQADEEERQQDIIIATTTLTYIWIFPVGTIAAGVTMGIYSDKAIKMANEIKGLNKIITEEGAELESSLRLIAELDLIRSQMQDLLKKIGPAIHALGLMRGVWGAIADDLRNIRSAVDGTSGNSRIIIQKLSQKKIVDRWNALGKEVDAFRKAAYVDAPKEMTASEAAGYFNKLGEVKTAS